MENELIPVEAEALLTKAVLFATWLGLYPKGIRYRRKYAELDFNRMLSGKAPSHLKETPQVRLVMETIITCLK